MGKSQEFQSVEAFANFRNALEVAVTSPGVGDVRARQMEARQERRDSFTAIVLAVGDLALIPLNDITAAHEAWATKHAEQAEAKPQKRSLRQIKARAERGQSTVVYPFRV